VGGAIQKAGPFINTSLMFLGVTNSRLSEGGQTRAPAIPRQQGQWAHDAAVALAGGMQCEGTFVTARGVLMAVIRIR